MTLLHLVIPSAFGRLMGEDAMFCGTPGCDVVYYTATTVVGTREVTVRVFQKETGSDRPVCYCFSHTVAAVLAAELVDGSNTIVSEITQACRQGLDRCDETNPQGRCCLGNVRGLRRGVTQTSCGDCV